MKWLQASRRDGSRDAIRLGYLDDGKAYILRMPYMGIESVLELLWALEESTSQVQNWLQSAVLADVFDEVDWTTLADGRSEKYELRYPVTPPEVWGCGVTYRRSADFRESSASRWRTMCRRGISSARIRCICRSRKSIAPASRLAPGW
jgi:hypothetical protein